MKHFRILIAVLLAVGFSSGLTAQPVDRAADEMVGEIEQVMSQWQASMRSMDAGRLASHYWDDATRIFAFTSGGREVIEGLDPIIGQQEANFRRIQREDPNALRRFTLPEPEILHLPDRLPLFLYREESGESVQIFHFEERFGRIAISRHAEIINIIEPVEASEELAWADDNRNGILEPEEQQFAINQYYSLTRGPHRVRGFLDNWFDWDGNGTIDEPEGARAWTILFRDGLRQGYRFFPEFTERFVDHDHSGSVSIREAEMVAFIAFGRELETPRPISNLIDELIDIDMDGWIIMAEAQVFLLSLTRAIASIPGLPVTNPTTPADMQWVVWWADADESGFLDESELLDVGITLFRLLHFTQLVVTPIDLLYDENRDYMISDDERAAALEDLQRLMPMNQRQAIARIASAPDQLFGRAPSTPMETRMDTDPRDNVLEQHEVVLYMEGIFQAIGETWLGESGAGGIQMVTTGQESLWAQSDDPQGAEAKPWEPADGGKERDPAGDPQAQTDPTVAQVDQNGNTTGNATPAVARPAGVADQIGDELSIAVRFNPVYPVLRQHYDTTPVGSVTVTNTGSTEVTDIEVSLSMSRYIDQARVYDEIASLAPGESLGLDLTMLFNTTVLEITEGDRIDATVTVSYRIGGTAAEESATETMIFYNRNAIRWDDTRKVAAFVTQHDEEVRSYARRVIAGSRDERNDAVDDSLQDAMALFVAMVESDLMYFRDPSSSYASASTSGTTIDYMQFPRQTLTDYGGDCDDLSVCFNALLESVGRRTAFVTVPGHILPAVALEMSASEARSAFMDPTDLIFDQDGTVWVPVEVTALDDSFYEAWQDGARTYRQYVGSGQAEVISTATAWSVYESVASFVDDDVEAPDQDTVSSEFADAVAQFVSTQIASRELQIEADLVDRPGDRRLLNRLGVLYAQYGKWESAKSQFDAIVQSEEYIPALLNLGHISFLDEEYRDAVAYYDRVLAIQSDHPSALLASARAHHELENYGNVRSYYEQLRVLSPRLAADYSYLDLGSTNEAARSQAASDLSDRVIWEENDSEASQE